MRGAVAAGHPESARAGARMLEQGGNAVDACVAAAFAAAVCESPLTGLGAGGFMLVHRPGDRGSRLADFFVAAPGLGATRPRGGPMTEIDVDFGDSPTTQPFRIGPASVAVPGLVPGLEAAHRAFGRLPWRELVLPACELAQGGVTLTGAQAHVHSILDPIIRRFEEGRRVYSGPGGRLEAGALLRLPDLADTLERVGRQGAAALGRGRVARALVAAVREGGGELTLADLAAYRPVWRRPVSVRFAGNAVVSNPPPSAGGILVAYGLALLARQRATAAGGTEALAALVEVMREQSRAREHGFGRALQRGGLPGRLLAPEALQAALRRVEGRTGAVAARASAPGGTTHVSVLDGDGTAASLSSSTGSGSGVIVPGTGIYLNNMLGEDDLVGARRPAPGRRLTSMMAPTIALGRTGRPRLVLGSAGSARLRGAILQVAVNVLRHGLGVAEAIEAPRLHLEEPLVHCEDGQEADALAGLTALGYELVVWPGRNLYFGGVAAVERGSGGRLAAAGDSRRGGAGVVVE